MPQAVSPQAFLGSSKQLSHPVPYTSHIEAYSSFTQQQQESQKLGFHLEWDRNDLGLKRFYNQIGLKESKRPVHHPTKEGG